MIKTVFNAPLKAMHKYEDIMLPLVEKTGLFQLDAKLQNFIKEEADVGGTMFQSAVDLVDKLHISNRARLDSYNRRNPDNPLYDPYTNE